MPISLIDTSGTTLPDPWIVSCGTSDETFSCIDDALGAIKTLFEDNPSVRQVIVRRKF